MKETFLLFLTMSDKRKLTTVTREKKQKVAVILLVMKRI